jgi:hypothetical protein
MCDVEIVAFGRSVKLYAELEVYFKSLSSALKMVLTAEDFLMQKNSRKFRISLF